MSDEWKKIGGTPASVALHATTRDGSDEPEFSKQVMCTDLGELVVSPSADGFAVDATILGQPLETNETLYSSWSTLNKVSQATASPTTGEQLPSNAATGGFMLIADPANVGTVYVGSSASTCFVPLPQGTPFSLSLPNTNLAYLRADEDGDGVFLAVYTV